MGLLRLILRYVLVRRSPLALGTTLLVPNPNSKFLDVFTSILRACHETYHISLPILYGENFITTSTPSSSKHFDALLQALPVKHRQFLRHIRLEIDWGDELWAHLPLVSKGLQDLQLLRNLEIDIVASHALEDVRVRMRREGKVVDRMVEIERKILKDMVGGLKGLKVFKLRGFVDGDFAGKLERVVCERRR
ncbi:uncharacterized protein KY384_008418 [Bacidia gigantensis]|uniref:uncharacterized protein n=1 Tax=Bacidia gigantensis TaxID=2732470 RepID=UPI001D0410A3|nr:uncharacterized protein KY384_008418 [Bacidia gigantensis]KAG8526989.1 hypothetical protein KY384_008418 [Bacidia gigantensis]